MITDFDQAMRQNIRLVMFARDAEEKRSFAEIELQKCKAAMRDLEASSSMHSASSENHSENYAVIEELDETKKELECLKQQVEEDKKFSDEKNRKLRELQQEVEKLRKDLLEFNSKALVPYSRFPHENINVMEDKIRWLNQKLIHQEKVFLRELNHRNDIILDATSQIQDLNKELNVMQISYHFFKNLVKSSGLLPRNIKLREVGPSNDQHSMPMIDYLDKDISEALERQSSK